MSRFLWKIYQDRELFGLIYTMEHRGDGVGMHSHQESDKHNIIMMRGRCEVYGPEKRWSHVLEAGDVFVLTDEHHPHEIMALEDGTTFLGLSVHGMPNGYDADTEADCGMIERCMAFPLEDQK